MTRLTDLYYLNIQTSLSSSISRPYHYVLKATRTIPINSVTRIVFNLRLLKKKTMFMQTIKDFANNITFTSVSLFDDSP